MPTPPLNTIRNIGIISHIDAGKTTVSERILFYSGSIHRMGEVHDGSATMDWMEQEQERGITITATANSCLWKETWINLIDTPGHIDFTIEVERSLRVLDGAIAIFSAVEGVQPQSESVWHQANRYGIPRICFINKMDRIGADHLAVLNQMEQRLHARPVLLQLPVGVETDFHGVIDLLRECVLSFAGSDQGATVEQSPIPLEQRETAASAREKVIEIAADFDDEILRDFLEGKPISEQRITRALRKGTLAGEIHPVLLGTALRNRGIQPLLDAVCTFLPSPIDIPPALAHPPGADREEIRIPCDPDGPLCALAFKVVSEEGRKLTYIRLYSGGFSVGDELWNASRGAPEKIARLFRMHAHRRERFDHARAGDIVAATGLRGVLTGDTLSSSKRPIVLQGLSVPEPVVSLAVEPKGVDDREKLQPALEKLQWEDPTFKVREDAETGQTILTGMGELHLEILLDRLRREFGVSVNSGPPQVIHRETLLQSVRRHELFQRDIDGRLHRGEILLQVRPLARQEGLRLRLPDPEDSPLPPHLYGILRHSLEEGSAAGPLLGFPLTDVEIEVLEAPFDPSSTSDLGLRAAAQRGLAMACREGGATLMEPVMELELVIPSEYAGRVLGSLQQKRGRIEGMESRESSETIHAKVPLSELFGYMTELRSATRGRGTFTMQFSHFDLAPGQETLRQIL